MAPKNRGMIPCKRKVGIFRAEAQSELIKNRLDLGPNPSGLLSSTDVVWICGTHLEADCVFWGNARNLDRERFLQGSGCQTGSRIGRRIGFQKLGSQLWISIDVCSQREHPSESEEDVSCNTEPIVPNLAVERCRV